MRDCPKCTAPIADAAVCCNSCGWQAPGSAARAISAAVGTLGDPLRWVCAHEDRGQRCGAFARFTESTNGAGRIYCLDHFPPFGQMRAGKWSGPTPAFQAIKVKMRQFADIPKDIDEESVAERKALQGEW